MRVLLVAYYFPPLSGAGIARPLSLFKYLPKHGIECDVLTVRGIAYKYYEPQLLDELDLKKIYRVHSWDPQRLMYMLGVRRVKKNTVSKGRQVNKRLFPDLQVGWVRPAVNLGRTLIENKRHDIIITTSPPVSNHLVGMKLSEEFNLPWIADFRDFWASYKPEDWFQSESMLNKSKRLLDEITQKASAVTCANREISESLNNGVVIRNSFDSERAKLWSTPDTSDIIIGCLGAISELTPIEPLFKFIKEIETKNKPLYDRIKIMHVGETAIDSLNLFLDDYNLHDKFQSYGYKGRVESIEILNQSSLMYLGISPKAGRGNTTSRIFDLIASKRPIIAWVDRKGEAAELLNEAGLSSILDNDNNAQSIEFTEDVIDNKKYRHIDRIGKHSSENMVKQFIDLMEKTVIRK